MVLVRFCPAAVLKDLLTGDFEQHFRVIFGLGEQRVGKERRGNHGTTSKPWVFEVRHVKKHAWEGSWIRKLRSLGRRKRELPRRGCVCCPQTPANPAQDLLTSHFEECFRLSGGARASFEKDS